jgi:2-dehydro-3-deoxy-D-arabinonate dehydratase
MWIDKFLDQHGATVWALETVDGVFALPHFSLREWMIASVDRQQDAVDTLVSLRGDAITLPEARLAPLDSQDVWAAGVTYARSRAARQEEAQDGGDIYARVYGAARPELFLKARAGDSVGNGGAVGIRADSAWNVPEPELGVLFNPAMQAMGFVIGNDMSSRSIEGENPLYLPQAKVYIASCAISRIWVQPMDSLPQLKITLTITRNGALAFSGETHTSKIVRTLTELADYLGRSQYHRDGVVLLTGTGLVPDADFTLQAGDQVAITIDEIGSLNNTVMEV